MMIVFFKKNVLLRYYFFHADDYLNWMMTLEDSGTDFFRLVVIVNHILEDLIMYVCAYTYTNTLMVESFFYVLDYYI